MKFCNFLAVLCFLYFGTEAVLGEKVPPVINETQGKESACKCTDNTALLKKLISDMENVKGQMLNVMPELIHKLASGLKDVKDELASDLKDVKDELMGQGNRIESSVQIHDQRLQILTDSCRNSIGLCDCSTIKTNGYTTSGVYRIFVDHPAKRYYANVYCDMTTGSGGWTVFQRRRDGSEDFYRGWNDYATGFGNTNGEFWLGNDFLHLLTSKQRYKLRVDLGDFTGNKRYAEYSTFSISSSADKYRLTVGTYSGNAGDSLTYHSNRQFSTKDQDNDVYKSNCSNRNRGAWWYGDCYHSNLNGIYYHAGSYSGKADGIEWYHSLGRYSLKSTEMKLSPY